MWAELSNSNALQTRYLHGDQVDQLFARQDAGVQYWYLTDYQGSVRDVLDNSGNVKDAINYDGFGNIISETNSAYRGSYAWTGQIFDTATYLQDNRARWYDPSTARWMSQDPLGFDAGDSNLYRYAANAPTIATDPSGLDDTPSMPTPQQWLAGDVPAIWRQQQQWQMDAARLTADGSMTSAQMFTRLGPMPIPSAPVVRNEPWYWQAWQAVGDTANGMADTITFGGMRRWNEAYGNDRYFNYDSNAYHTGGLLGTAWQIGMLYTGPAALVYYVAGSPLIAMNMNDAYNSYLDHGFGELSALGMALATNLPVAGSVVSVIELIQGQSLRAGDYGQDLNGWGVANRGIGVVLDLVTLRSGAQAARARLGRGAAPNNPMRPGGQGGQGMRMVPEGPLQAGAGDLPPELQIPGGVIGPEPHPGFAGPLVVPPEMPVAPVQPLTPVLPGPAPAGFTLPPGATRVNWLPNGGAADPALANATLYKLDAAGNLTGYAQFNARGLQINRVDLSRHTAHKRRPNSTRPLVRTQSKSSDGPMVCESSTNGEARSTRRIALVSPSGNPPVCTERDGKNVSFGEGRI